VPGRERCVAPAGTSRRSTCSSARLSSRCGRTPVRRRCDSSRITPLLEKLAGEIGVRRCGTPAAAAAARAIADAFYAIGLEPRLQEFPFLRFDPEEPELEVDGEPWVAGPCMYALPGECEGVVEQLRDGLWAVGEGRLVRSLYGRGPIPFTVSGRDAGYVAAPPTAYLSRADDARLRAGSHARLVTRGVWTQTRDCNVIAKVRGASEEKVVVGAHYDSVWRGPGAIDNATGVEGVVRLAEHFAGRPLPRTLEFAAFGAEEVGLVGARRYIAAARERDELGAIAGMVNLDCIGHGEKLQLLSSTPALLDDALAALRRLGLEDRYELLAETALEDAGTDHVPFAAAGIPAISILHFPYEEYHLPEDSLDLVEEQLIADTVELAAELVEALLVAARAR
jgi:aminopeptidase YwaD